MAYRLAKSLIALRDSVNVMAPVRSRVSDGWIGDPAHASRASDHNPHVKDGNVGIVTALDITHDPANGVDGGALAKELIKDARVKYVIWDRKIWNPSIAKAWRKYSGKNPHTHHVHVSVLGKKPLYDDTTAWKVPASGVFTEAAAPAPIPIEKRGKQILRLRSQGGDVFELQRLLGIKSDGDFGQKTLAAVKAFQKTKGLVADGVVGHYTWEALFNTDTSNKESEPAFTVKRLMDMGWSFEEAVAWTAHFMWESGGHKKNTIDWKAKGDAGNSKGAGQWNKAAGRWEGLDRFAALQETDWTDREAQLGFFNHELMTTEQRVAKAVREAGTLEDKVKAAVSYWRPGIPHTDRRIKIANDLKKELSK